MKDDKKTKIAKKINPFPKEFRRYSPQEKMDKTVKDLKLLYKK